METAPVSIDPVLRQLIESLPTPPEGEPDFPAIRMQAAAMTPLLVPAGSLTPVRSIEDRMIDGYDAAVPLRIYRPATEPKGVMHYIHGGGWVLGDLATVDHTARRLCDGLSMTIVTSTYRLAPEHPFPAAVDDSLAAARWTRANRRQLGGDGMPMVLAGDSAGGNLAAIVATLMRDAEEDTFDALMLLYPALDLRPSSYSYPSRVADADPTLRVMDLKRFAKAYVAGSDTSDPRLSPLASPRLADLPPTLLVVLSVDPLRDEAIAYADSLRREGVPVETMEFGNLTHGFVHLAALVPAAASATDAVMRKLEELLKDTA